ncbi:DUF58 domain-containing protein [Planosporangium flavigriseum]|uniref:DUF58 domain-containing protein n=1 Tax=Planosporangium flavigriseum TaxID=373681 RepID=A0A8J3LTD7_9ACTN|nr:DUF58 domain-containing protein [Planosporangium flavigriseum]NJC65409.1 DUF58 domain-containing protein [Planosporangium flavigriseum]GIG73236.1 hypothetical protein Pfl04_16400 [Planosporangium flavigriseum]
MTITKRGIGLLVAGLILLATGFRFGYPELTVLGCAGLLAVLLAHAYAALRPRLAVTRRAEPDRVMRGEDSRMTLTVRNANRVRAATLIAYDRCGPATVPVPVLQLRPGQDTVTEYPVPTARRGVVAVGPLRIVRRDPLSLVTMARSHGETARVWVYPKVHPLSAVPVGVVRSLDGRVDRVPHGTITFDTLRGYVVGDELRHVHWRTSARVGELMVREHLDTSLPRLVVLLDDRPVAHPGLGGGTSDSFESACEAAASIVMAAQREELPLTLQTVTGVTAGGDGRRITDTRPYLDLLAEAQLRDSASPGDGDELSQATARLRQRRLGDTLVYLTGPGRADDLGQVGSLRGAYPTIIVGALGALGATGSAPAPTEGMVVLSAADGADFAAEWDGVRAW